MQSDHRTTFTLLKKYAKGRKMKEAKVKKIIIYNRTKKRGKMKQEMGKIFKQ